ncbi:MAG: hypothetical protein JHC82_17210 [Stenotrophomonas sp.]|nr:hypothetical protein [Stenotrophomonas sp.]
MNPADRNSSSGALGHASLAGRLLIGEFVVAIVLGVVLDGLGVAGELALLPLWLFNLLVAHHLGRAAQLVGRNRWLYTLAAVFPPVAIAVYLFIHSDALARSLDRTP